MGGGLLRALGLLLVSAACASPAGSGSLSGTVSYRERMALPEGAVVKVVLLDVSLVDAPARVIAEQEIRPTQQVPVPFTLAYDPSELERGHRYGLRASIQDVNGRLLWGTTSSHPVFGADAPETHALVLQRAREVLSYACDAFAFRVEVAADGVRLSLPDGRSLDLPAVPSASGARYSDGRSTFWSKGDEALLTLDGVEHAGCRLAKKTAP
jgi:putative lipoprotein